MYGMSTDPDSLPPPSLNNISITVVLDADGHNFQEKTLLSNAEMMTRMTSFANTIVGLLLVGLSALIAVDGTYALALPQPAVILRRDVWAPEITSPKAGDVWRAGDTVQVTWSTEDPPASVTNPDGLVVLRTPVGIVHGPGGLSEPLASNFSLFDGKVNVQVPDVPGRSDYQIVLFGDSGNDSPQFTIANSVLAPFPGLGLL